MTTRQVVTQVWWMIGLVCLMQATETHRLPIVISAVAVAMGWLNRPVR